MLTLGFCCLQICYGIDDNSLGTCFQLVFAPIDEHFPDDVPLLASGFRVMLLDTKTVKHINDIFYLSMLYELIPTKYI